MTEDVETRILRLLEQFNERIQAVERAVHIIGNRVLQDDEDEETIH